MITREWSRQFRRNFLFAILLTISGRSLAAELTGHWKGPMEIDGVSYLMHWEVFEQEDPVSHSSYLLNRFEFARNDVTYESYHSEGFETYFYFYSVKGLGVGTVRPSGVVTGYWLKGQFDSTAQIFTGTVQEILTQSSGSIESDSKAIGTFEFKKGSSIAENRHGSLEFPSLADPAKPIFYRATVIVYGDGKVEVVGNSKATTSRLRLSGRVEDRAISFFGYIYETDALGTTYFAGYRFFEGLINGRQIDGEIFAGDYDAGIGNYVKTGAALGNFSFR